MCSLQDKKYFTFKLDLNNLFQYRIYVEIKGIHSVFSFPGVKLKKKKPTGNLFKNC